MDKTAIKNFAIWARKKLIGDISYKANLLGITPDAIRSALPQSTREIEFYDIGMQEPYAISGKEIEQRRNLAELIRQKEQSSDYATAYNSVIEEVAYTWFNRLIAVRFMEVNDYLPSHTRILSSDSKNKLEPDIVTNPFDTELTFTEKEKEQIIQWQHENAMDSLFMLLFIKVCNALNELLPQLFEKTADYTELLLNLSVTDRDGVVYHLVHDIPEKDFDVEQGGQVEIIGWLYQYYISEKHEEVVDPLHGKVVKKEEIPAATQLFTTDWVVRYLIDNSVGRYWIERRQNSSLATKLHYFVKPQNGLFEQIKGNITPQELSIFDPCVGSGHFLVYAFEVLMYIYKECGYTEREAASEIIKNNIYGLDIDGRAIQLAYFAVMMKARQYDRRFLSHGIQPHIYEINESNTIDKASVEYFYENDISLKSDIMIILATLKDAKEYGSILQMPMVDFGKINERLVQVGKENSLYSTYLFGEFKSLIRTAEILCKKYAVVATNPPYFNRYDNKLKTYIMKNFRTYSGDLFSVFMKRNFAFCKDNGYVGFMTTFVWMFIKKYENTRHDLISNRRLVTLIQFEYSAYEEATVPICSFVLANDKRDVPGLYFKLSAFRGGMEKQREMIEKALMDLSQCNYFYMINQKEFLNIPSEPFAFWANDTIISAFKNSSSLGDYALSRNGMKTGDNDTFLRLWWEVVAEKLKTDCKNYKDAEKSGAKWFPYNKGGEYRKWYGNNDFIVNWENLGDRIFYYAIKDGRHVQDYPLDLKFIPTLSWSLITSAKPAFRYKEGNLSDIAGMSLFTERNKIIRYLGLLNSCVALDILQMLAPTINFQAGDIARIPVIEKINVESKISSLVEKNILLSKNDWDSFETSWDFKSHPLVPLSFERKEQLAAGMNTEERWKSVSLLSSRFVRWERECNDRFGALKKNEEELNRIFIDIYGLQDELTPVVEDKDVTVRKADLQRDIRSLISYAVGCMFGRYSIDRGGLAYAGGEWDYNFYTAFTPDEDNVIPITDEEYFDDDIVGVFCKWLATVYGKDTLEENLDFIARALGNSGNTSREIIRNYFLKDFYKDHCKIYQKRPIYWLFDSGKQNGFKALIYLHRYNRDTIGNMRAEYLHRMEHVYESEINRMNALAEQSEVQREAANARKRAEKLQKQLQECREYDEKVGHLAVDRIELDLDDGVKVNYEKLQTDRNGKKYQILAKI